MTSDSLWVVERRKKGRRKWEAFETATFPFTFLSRKLAEFQAAQLPKAGPRWNGHTYRAVEYRRVDEQLD